MERMGRLDGRVAIVTGAASGIGFACAQRFADEGAVVVGVDVREAPTTWQQIDKAAPAASYHVVDVRDGAAQQRVADAVAAEHGRIDVLLTSAGVPGGGPVHLLSEEDWDRTQDVNLKGTFLSVKSVLPTMIEQRSGSIITIASVEGLEGAEGGSTYNASKGGVILLTKNLCLDYGRRGIRANAICPGFIETPMFESVMGAEAFAEYRDKIRDQHKLGRFGKPEEIAGCAIFLASDDASFVSGQAIAVDGGFTAGHRFGYTALMGLD
jgi:NAD(P)-dependent dehydrogenase (short-subunit alcohol dehydrogenase family)